MGTGFGTKNANLDGADLSTSPVLRKCLSFGRKQALWRSAGELRPMSPSTFIYRNLDEHLQKRMSLTRRPKVRESHRLGFGAHCTQTAVALHSVIVLGESEGLRSVIFAFFTGRNVPDKLALPRDVSGSARASAAAVSESGFGGAKRIATSPVEALARTLRRSHRLSLDFSSAREGRCCRGEHTLISLSVVKRVQTDVHELALGPQRKDPPMIGDLLSWRAEHHRERLDCTQRDGAAEWSRCHEGKLTITPHDKGVCHFTAAAGASDSGNLLDPQGTGVGIFALDVPAAAAVSSGQSSGQPQSTR